MSDNFYTSNTVGTIISSLSGMFSGGTIKLVFKDPNTIILNNKETKLKDGRNWSPSRDSWIVLQYMKTEKDKGIWYELDRFEV